MIKLLASCICCDRFQLWEVLQHPPGHRLHHYVTCDCQHCTALREFFEHPEQDALTLALPEEAVMHIQR